MKNMISYIRATRSKSFSEKPFCEGDSLVLAKLVYLHYGSYLEHAENPNLGEAVKVAVPPSPPEKMWNKLFRAIAKSRRFAPITLEYFTEKIDENKEEQFAAVVYTLPSSLRYIAFRGTDESFVGWKEDFNMTFLPTVPAQEEATRYLCEVEQREKDGIIFVGGHSKGGNLAIYAAAKAPQWLQKRIRAVYNHDGPGFRKEFYENSAYDKISSRLNTTIPKASLVGRIACHDKNYRIVAGKGFGTQQHEPFHWAYTKEGLRYEFISAKQAVFLSQTFQDWFACMDEEKKEAFIETVYDLVNDTGIESLNVAKKHWLTAAKATLNSYQKLDEESKTFISEILSLLWETAKDNLKKKKSV